ncbi:MAG TPA: hypothetical protein VFY40_07460 [Blastocatellia bacterium]|nr:hypothetical protein [Blastocatellia bacterium]
MLEDNLPETDQAIGCCAPTVSPAANYQKVQFEDEQIRVTRLLCAPGKGLDIPAGASGPALLIALAPARLGVIGLNGKSSKLNLGLGQTGWQPAGKPAQLESQGGAPAELLRFEFKTRPSGEPVGNPKAHEHSHE